MNKNDQLMHEKPTLYMMAGGPGSGKGYIIAKHYSELSVVDCDRIKSEHPDYDPKNPSALHEWSSIEASREFYWRLSIGDDFIYDGTGTNAEKYIAMANAAHAAGFNVTLVYVKASLVTSLRRNAERARTVPEHLVIEKHASIATSVALIRDTVNSVEIYLND